MIKPGSSAPHEPPKRQSWVWLVLPLLAVVAITAFLVNAGAQSRRLQEARDRFEAYLKAEDFAAAEQELEPLSLSRNAWSRDAEERLAAAMKLDSAYRSAVALVEAKEWEKALPALTDLKAYKDTATHITTVRYELAKKAVAEQKWADAKIHLEALPMEYQDTPDMRKVVTEGLTQQFYKEGMEARARKEWSRAEGLLTSAKAAGGKVPTNIDAVIKEMGDLAQKEAAANRLAQIKGQQNYYTSGTVQLAVGNAEFRTGLSNKVAGENGAFVLVYASIKNAGTRSEHANPVNFKLSTPDGYTVPTTSEMYSLNNTFDAVDLANGQKTAGWLAFYIKRSETYTLHYEGFNGSASKEIAPEW